MHSTTVLHWNLHSHPGSHPSTLKLTSVELSKHCCVALLEVYIAAPLGSSESHYSSWAHCGVIVADVRTIVIDWGVEIMPIFLVRMLLKLCRIMLA